MNGDATGPCDSPAAPLGLPGARDAADVSPSRSDAARSVVDASSPLRRLQLHAQSLGTSFDGLPDDVAVEVLTRLPLTARGLLACTSRRWARLASDPRVWRRLRFDGVRTLTPETLNAVLARARAAGAAIESIDLRCAHARSVFMVQQMGDLLAHFFARPENEGSAAALRTLHMGFAAAFSPSACASFARACGAVQAHGSEVTVHFAFHRARGWAEEDEAAFRVPPCAVRVVASDVDGISEILQRLQPPLPPLAPGHPDVLTLERAVRTVARRGGRIVEIHTHTKADAPNGSLNSLPRVETASPGTLAALHTLDLRGCARHGQTGGELATMLAGGACPQLQKLNLSGCAGILHDLCQAVAALPSLTWLDVSRCGLGPAGAAALAAGLLAAAQAGRTRPLHLDANNCELRDAGLLRLADAVAQGAALSALLLNRNSLTDVGTSALAAAFSRRYGTAAEAASERGRNSLRALSLADNTIRAGGASALADAFADGALSGLQSLDMHNNTLYGQGAAHLATALRLPSSRCALRVLDVGDCVVGDQGVVALATALRGNTTLRDLSVLNSGAGDAGISALVAALTSPVDDVAAGGGEISAAPVPAAGLVLEALQVGPRVTASEAWLEALRHATRNMPRCWVPQPPKPEEAEGAAAGAVV
jgi:hypothetical protein